MAVCTIDGISLTRNGSPISQHDVVRVGDSLGVTVDTDPDNEPVLLNIGKDPKSGCILCDLDCAPDSDHIEQRNTFDGQEELFSVTEQWLTEAKKKDSNTPFLLVEASCKGTFNSSELCSEQNVAVDIRPVPVSVSTITFPPNIIVGEQAPIQFSLNNGGTTDASGVATLTVDGGKIGSKQVTVGAGSTVTEEITWTPVFEGTKDICVSFNGSELCQPATVSPPTSGEACTIDVPVIGQTSCLIGGLGAVAIVGTGIILTSTDI